MPSAIEANVMNTSNENLLPRTEGLIFLVGILEKTIPNGIGGIVVENRVLKERPVLERIDRGNVIYWFVAISPHKDMPHYESLNSLLHLPEISVLNEDREVQIASIQVYAQWKADYSKVESILEEFVDTRTMSGQLQEIVHKLRQDAYDCSCTFVNTLRRRYQQYWLLPPEPNSDLAWAYISYYSVDHKSWHYVRVDDDFEIAEQGSTTHLHKHEALKIFQAISTKDVASLHSFNSEKAYSFAEEMIATALVEFSNGNLRSATVHSVIALEASSQNGLKYLLKTKLHGLEQAKILDAISKEVSVALLARIVYKHLEIKQSDSSINWEIITDLCNTRNTVVHKGQRRLDPSKIRAPILEVYRYVREVENQISQSI